MCPVMSPMSASDGQVPLEPAAPPRPRPSPFHSSDPWWLFALNAVVIGFMWVKHGGIDRIEPHGWLIAVGQVTGLYAALAALAGLVLTSRAPWLERRYGQDQMVGLHRYTGFTAATLMIVHVTVVTLGYAFDTGITVWEQIVDSVTNYAYVLNAVIGFGLLMLVAGSSLRALRRALSYEIWWFIHLGSYVGLLLAFGHQTAIGSDFVDDGWAVLYWSLLYLSVAALIFGHRWLTPFVLALRHRFEVVEVHSEGPGVVTVVLGGRDLDRLPVQAGQFFVLRELAKGRWWKAHPFSLSAVPDGRTLRFTIKALGDDSSEFQSIDVGARFSIEGPYGGFLPHRTTGRRILYIAGGVGITPFRGLIDDVSRPQDVALLYRTRSPEDAVFLDQLQGLSATKGFALELSFSRITGGDLHPFAPERLLEFVPDLLEREVFVVGPPPMISAARNGLRAAGVPASHVHLESFGY